jgi:hypothetical protein
MGLLDILRSYTDRKYLPKVAPSHVAAPYTSSGAKASYSHTSGLIYLPISHIESDLASQPDPTSVVVIKLHKPVTTKNISYSNERHGRLPEVYEPSPDVYENPDKGTATLGTVRSVDSPAFGAFETHGAAFAASGSTAMVFTTSEHFSAKDKEKIPQASYDGTQCADVPTLKDYPRRVV